MRQWALLCAGLLVVVMWSGCAPTRATRCRRECCCQGVCQGSCTGATAEMARRLPGPAIARARVAADLSLLDAGDAVVALPPESWEYRELPAWQCQCRAAEQSTMGNLLSSESRVESAGGGACGRDDEANDSVRRRALAARAVQERNASAADALELFYRLAEAEAAADQLDRSLAEVDQAVEDFDALRAQGFELEADQSELVLKRLDLLARQTELRDTLRQLNGRLRTMLGFAAEPGVRIWPAADLTVTPEPIDVESAIDRALALRGDVAALEILDRSAHRDTLPAVRGGLQGVNPLLGATGPLRRRLLLGRSDTAKAEQQELSARRRQLDRLLGDGRRRVEQEVREAASAVESSIRQIVLARRRRDERQENLDSLEEKRGADGVSPFDLSAARLELIQAENDLVHRVVDWKIAVVKLKEAQGLLASECGYRPPNPCR